MFGFIGDGVVMEDECLFVWVRMLGVYLDRVGLLILVDYMFLCVGNVFGC